MMRTRIPAWITKLSQGAGRVLVAVEAIKEDASVGSHAKANVVHFTIRVDGLQGEPPAAYETVQLGLKNIGVEIPDGDLIVSSDGEVLAEVQGGELLWKVGPFSVRGKGVSQYVPVANDDEEPIGPTSDESIRPTPSPINPSGPIRPDNSGNLMV